MTDLLELRTLLAKATPPVDGNKILIDRALLNRLPDLLDEVEKLRTENRALLEVAEAARRHRNCVFEQADRAARNSDAAMVCRHVKWNGGPAEESCAKLLWNAVAVLDSPNVKEGG